MGSLVLSPIDVLKTIKQGKIILLICTLDNPFYNEEKIFCKINRQQYLILILKFNT